jgi:GT2 family glycosyltransferase
LKDESNLFFSIVIPTYERPDDLRICLNSLSIDIQLGTPSYEIIVTDDSNSDESQRMVEKEFPNVSWGKGKQNGPAGNRNAGVARAKGKWIVFLDDDCIAQEGYLKAYAKTITANPDVLVFEGRIFADRPRKTLAEGAPINEDGGLLWTSNLCVNRKLFHSINGFDERFRYAYEDVEFAHRLKLNVQKTLFCKYAAVCHPWRHNIDSTNNWKKKDYALESLLIFLKIHPELRSIYTPTHFLKHALRGFIRITIPGIIKYKFKGSWFAISSNFNSIRTAWIVMRID